MAIRKRTKDFLAGSTVVLAGVYLLNFTLGIWELPDNLPVIGNIDEAVATALLLQGLAYFGISMGSLFGKREETPEIEELDHELVDN